VHIRLLAVGDRQPQWVEDAFDTYARRLPRQWRFATEVVGTANRQKNTVAEKAVAAESDRVLAKIRPEERVVVLDERGHEFSSRELAAALHEWQADGRDLVFVIGGPDGVSPACLARADTRWSLSRLTLPHGLARVLFAEQLYRAWSLATGHPYHRE